MLPSNRFCPPRRPLKLAAGKLGVYLNGLMLRAFSEQPGYICSATSPCILNDCCWDALKSPLPWLFYESTFKTYFLNYKLFFKFISRWLTNSINPPFLMRSLQSKLLSWVFHLIQGHAEWCRKDGEVLSPSVQTKYLEDKHCKDNIF